MLEAYTEFRKKSAIRGVVQLALYDDEVKIHDTFKVIDKGAGFNYLVWRMTGEEVSLDVMGFVAGLNLPPVTKSTR